MASILDLVAESRYRFVPSTRLQYLVLQIARKLNALAHVRDLLVLSEHYSEDLLVKAFRACRDAGTFDQDSFLTHFRKVIHHDEQLLELD